MAAFRAVIVVLVVEAAVAFAVIWSGAYDVAASHPDNAFTRKLLSTVKDRSILRHARGIRAPNLKDGRMAQVGAALFNEDCQHCHGAPGLKRTEMGEGMYPHPPDLAKAERQWSDGELYWIVKNGIKLAGMPGFGREYRDEQVWSMVAFLRQLPTMTQGRYHELARAKGGDRERGVGGHGAAEPKDR